MTNLILTWDLSTQRDFTSFISRRYIPYTSNPPSPDMAQMCDDLGIEPRLQARGVVRIVDIYHVPAMQHGHKSLRMDGFTISNRQLMPHDPPLTPAEKEQLNARLRRLAKQMDEQFLRVARKSWPFL